MATKTITEFAGVSSPDDVDELLMWSVAASGTRKVRIKDLFNSNDNVGIGTNAPVRPLHVYRSSGTASLEVESDDDNAFIVLDAGSASDDPYIIFTQDGGTRWVMGSAGFDGSNQFVIGSGGSELEATVPRLSITLSGGVRVHNDIYTAQSTSWNPTLSGTTGITYGTRNGAYKRLGNIVFFSFRVAVTDFNASASAVTITLPTGTALTGGAAAVAGNDEVFYDMLALRWEATASAFTLMTYAAGAGWIPAEWSVGGFDSSGFVLYGGGAYFVS